VSERGVPNENPKLGRCWEERERGACLPQIFGQAKKLVRAPSLRQRSGEALENSRFYRGNAREPREIRLNAGSSPDMPQGRLSLRTNTRMIRKSRSKCTYHACKSGRPR